MAEQFYYHRPPIHPDETLQSWLLRVCERQGVSYRVFSENALGRRVKCPSGDAYPNFDSLCLIDSSASACEDEILQRHTLVGALRPLCTGDEWLQEKIRCRIGGRTRRGSQSIIICPDCHQAGRFEGVFRYYRNHQIPGLRYCWKCEAPLLVTRKIRSNCTEPPSNNDTVESCSLAVNSASRAKHHIRLARDVCDAISTHYSSNVGASEIGAKTVALMRQFISAKPSYNKKHRNGTICVIGDRYSYLTEFIEHEYGRELLPELGLSGANNSSGRNFSTMFIIALLGRACGTDLKTVIATASEQNAA
jgi:hypothetical protein